MPPTWLLSSSMACLPSSISPGASLRATCTRREAVQCSLPAPDAQQHRHHKQPRHQCMHCRSCCRGSSNSSRSSGKIGCIVPCSTHRSQQFGHRQRLRRLALPCLHVHRSVRPHRQRRPQRVGRLHNSVAAGRQAGRCAEQVGPSSRAASASLRWVFNVHHARCLCRAPCLRAGCACIALSCVSERAHLLGADADRHHLVRQLGLLHPQRLLHRNLWLTGDDGRSLRCWGGRC